MLFLSRTSATTRLPTATRMTCRCAAPKLRLLAPSSSLASSLSCARLCSLVSASRAAAAVEVASDVDLAAASKHVKKMSRKLRRCSLTSVEIHKQASVMRALCQGVTGR